jgi:response regulator RpfG family c-di-GMP phosphodiesterase
MEIQMIEKKRYLLCVDDERSILNSLKRRLRNEDYELIFTENGEDGLIKLSEYPVHVVISDQRMPEMTGTQFLQRVKELYPDTIRVILSGYAEVNSILDSINKGEVFRFLMKPWNDEELKTVIRQCFEQYDLLKTNKELMEKVKEQNERLSCINESLEGKVFERTKTLQLIQDIFNNITMPVIGIDPEKLLVVTNNAAIEKFSHLASLNIGTEIDNVLPGELVDVIEKCMTQKSNHPGFVFRWKNDTVMANISLLEENKIAKGCILEMKVKNNE